MKKRKKTTLVRPTLKKDLPQHKLEQCSAIVRKMFRFYDVDPSLFDRLSKKQKIFLLRVCHNVPHVHAEKPNSIPRRHVEAMRKDFFSVLTDNCVDESSNDLTYMEFITYGCPVSDVMVALHSHNFFKNSPQNADVLRQFAEGYEKGIAKYEAVIMDMWHIVRRIMLAYSQVNFRIYGYQWKWEDIRDNALSFPSRRANILLTAQDARHGYFTYKGISRLAYKVFTGDSMDSSFSPVVLREEHLYPGKKSDAELEIHIQSHAIHRFKERCDVFEPLDRNYLFSLSVTRQELVRCENTMFSVSIDDVTLGYFPFIIQQGKACITTFLPLVSTTTPEGKKLFQTLHLGKTDLQYLGMDKLSFFLSVDFDQIPMLKRALVGSGIWGVREHLAKEMLTPDIDPKKTQFVKEFFRKTLDHTVDVLLPDEPPEEEEI
jgi:hypothetical protein